MSDKPLAMRADTAPVLANERGVTFGSLAEMKSFAVDVVNSGLAPRDFKTPESVLVAMQHGMEVGLTPMAALQSIAVINGRPTLYGDGLMAVARSHPSCVDIIETFERGENDEAMRAVCEVQRKSQVPVIRTFSVDDAKKAQLWKKAGPWTTYPKRMLQMRARAFAIRDAFADALKGIRCAEEELDIPPRRVEARVVSSEIVLPGEDPAPLQIAENVETPAAPPAEELDADGNFKF